MSEERYKVHVSVQLILFNEKNEILLSKRKSTGYLDGQYGVVGGHLEKGEDVKSAIIREAKEEANINIKKEDLVLKNVMNRKINEDIQYVDFIFSTNKWSGNIKNMEPDKCSELIWCNKDELPEETIDFVKYYLNEYNDRLIILGW